MNKNYRPPEEFYKTISRKRIGAIVIFFNEEKEILLLNPNYKERWILPGGIVEKNESPREAAIRETKEEIALNVKNIKLVCINYIPDSSFKGDSINFIFYGGVLLKEQVNSIKLQKSELLGSNFFDKVEAVKMAKIGGKETKNSLKAIGENKILYLYGGKISNLR